MCAPIALNLLTISHFIEYQEDLCPCYCSPTCIHITQAAIYGIILCVFRCNVHNLL